MPPKCTCACGNVVLYADKNDVSAHSSWAPGSAVRVGGIFIKYADLVHRGREQVVCEGCGRAVLAYKEGSGLVELLDGMAAQRASEGDMYSRTFGVYLNRGRRKVRREEAELWQNLKSLEASLEKLLHEGMSTDAFADDEFRRESGLSQDLAESVAGLGPLDQLLVRSRKSHADTTSLEKRLNGKADWLTGRVSRAVRTLQQYEQTEGRLAHLEYSILKERTAHAESTTPRRSASGSMTRSKTGRADSVTRRAEGFEIPASTSTSTSHLKQPSSKAHNVFDEDDEESMSSSPSSSQPRSRRQSFLSDAEHDAKVSRRIRDMDSLRFVDDDEQPRGRNATRSPQFGAHTSKSRSRSRGPSLPRISERAEPEPIGASVPRGDPGGSMSALSRSIHHTSYLDHAPAAPPPKPLEESPTDVPSRRAVAVPEGRHPPMRRRRNSRRAPESSSPPPAKDTDPFEMDEDLHTAAPNTSTSTRDMSMGNVAPADTTLTNDNHKTSLSSSYAALLSASAARASHMSHAAPATSSRSSPASPSAEPLGTDDTTDDPSRDSDSDASITYPASVESPRGNPQRPFGEVDSTESEEDSPDDIFERYRIDAGTMPTSARAIGAAPRPPSNYPVGSVPGIPIAVPRRTSRIDSALLRKTSVPYRERMYVPPLPEYEALRKHH